MDKDKIERFVLYASERAFQPDSLSVVNIYSVIFSLIAFGYGILLGGIYLFISLLMVSLTAAYIVMAAVLKRRLRPSLQTGFLCNSIASASSVVLFALLGMMIFVMQEPGALQYLALAASYILVFAVYWALMMRAIRKDAFVQKRPRANNAATAATLGAVVGLSLARIFLSNVDQNILLVFLSTTWFFLSSLFSMGLINILKYYYCKKYGFEEVYPVPKPRKRKKMGKVKKALLALLVLVLLLLVAAVVFAWLIQNSYIPPRTR